MITLDTLRGGRKIGRIFRRCTCWKIELQNGTTIRVTDHDEYVYLMEDPTNIGTSTVDANVAFSPTRGLSGSAVQQQANVKAADADYRGVVDSGLIKESDLWAGVYREAQVTEYLVDWGFPYFGPLMSTVFYIDDVEWTGELWVAKVSGVSRKLDRRVGRVYGVNCGWDVGDANCQFSFGSTIETGTTIVSVTDRYRFKAFPTNGNWGTAGFYDHGKLEWLTGDNANAGVISEIRAATNWIASTSIDVELFLSTPFDISTSDTFKCWPGCDKLAATCNAKFNNLINFGGFPYIPRTDTILRAP